MDFYIRLVSLLYDNKAQASCHIPPSQFCPWTGKNSIPLLLVLATKVRSEGSFLLLGPYSHLPVSHGPEQNSAPTLSHKPNSKPCKKLEGIVWTCYCAKSEPLWNSSRSISWFPQVAERNVCLEITHFSENIKSNSDNINVIDYWGRFRGISCGFVDPVCQIHAGKEPVVKRVLEDICPWHGG